MLTLSHSKKSNCHSIICRFDVVGWATRVRYIQPVKDLQRQPNSYSPGPGLTFVVSIEVVKTTLVVIAGVVVVLMMVW